ncbi:ribosomal RNA small subunit methyltransferase A [Candidatus Aerophobetes bacterium]|nr:ribosomal RNA small subunit methyltransferase A [Candidatus Aerophobetes bacterium]
MRLKEETEYLCEKYNFTPKREWGQNFLIDQKILKRIIQTLRLTKEDIVMEIGAGTGILTEKLVQEGVRVIAVEVDKKLCKILREKFKNTPNLEIREEDIEKFLREEEFSSKRPLKVAGNLPYRIASSILLTLMEKEWVKFMVVMVQREIGERLIAKQGDKKRGVITILANYYTKISPVMNVPPQAFFPLPRVSSTLLEIKRRGRNGVIDKSRFSLIVKAAFSSRRKTLENSLSRALRIDKNYLREKLSQIKIDGKRRAETLDIEEFIKITNTLNLNC